MASQKAYSKEHETPTSSSNNQGIPSEENSTSSGTTNKSNLAKELARRALLRSHLRRNNGRRKNVSNNAKSLPSRLSKVSLGEDSAE
ncbi:hypothetical protein RIF29_41196 [Crotalaria pallida]|uniref:Uncharacterized protein n=1 Tax=Crotalaria pallida TaxID=3830 RepID=A0AAN9HRE2_CROPI